MDKTQFCNRLLYYINDEKKASEDYRNFAYQTSLLIAQGKVNPASTRILDVSRQETGHSELFQELYNTHCTNTNSLITPGNIPLRKW